MNNKKEKKEHKKVKFSDEVKPIKSKPDTKINDVLLSQLSRVLFEVRENTRAMRKFGEKSMEIIMSDQKMNEAIQDLKKLL